MPKRKYTNMKDIEAVILAMREDGKSLRGIARELGLDEKQMLNWSYRHNREQRNLQTGSIPKPKGRPRTQPLNTVEACQKEIARLEMENKLLRDFLQLTERK
jgi:transposase-like protein